MKNVRALIKFTSVGEAALLLGVSQRTLQHWCQENLVTSKTASLLAAKLVKERQRDLPVSVINYIYDKMIAKNYKSHKEELHSLASWVDFLGNLTEEEIRKLVE